MRIRIKQFITISLFGSLLLLLLSFSNTLIDDNTIEIVSIQPVQHHYQYVPTEAEMKAQQQEIARIPAVEKDFVGFKEALAFKESQGRYDLVNTLGYMGKYQFGKSTLKGLKINPKNFLKDPVLQEKAFLAYVKHNKWILRKEIKKFDGKWINGIKITESGILAAAHLGGAGAVQKYLWSYGKDVKKDAYGTSIEHYLKKFSGYNLKDIKPLKNPVIN